MILFNRQFSWADVVDLAGAIRCMRIASQYQANDMVERMRSSKRMRKQVLNHVRDNLLYKLWKIRMGRTGGEN